MWPTRPAFPVPAGQAMEPGPVGQARYRRQPPRLIRFGSSKTGVKVRETRTQSAPVQRPNGTTASPIRSCLRCIRHHATPTRTANRGSAHQPQPHRRVPLTPTADPKSPITTGRADAGPIPDSHDSGGREPSEKGYLNLERQALKSIVRRADPQRGRTLRSNFLSNRNRIRLSILFATSPSEAHEFDLWGIDSLDIDSPSRHGVSPSTGANRLDGIGEEEPPRLDHLHRHHRMARDSRQLDSQPLMLRAIRVIAVSVSVHDNGTHLLACGLHSFNCVGNLFDPPPNCSAASLRRQGRRSKHGLHLPLQTGVRRDQ